ncbi:MAG: glycosyltransferase family 2 protein [Bacteroidota bacterium]|nr:glycosyltransferase family 2 protein [Bacteroidota bacterium]
MNAVFFSIIIPTHNRKEMLRQCLDALARQIFPAEKLEVIVIDDGSNDGTAEYVRAAQFRFPLHCRTIENSGPSYARNCGALLASGKFLVFFEDDISPRDDALQKAHAHLATSDVDVLEGKTVYQHSNDEVRRFDTPEMYSFIPCNLFIRRGLFQSLGGYDVRFFDKASGLYFREDADLGFRLLDAGCRLQKADDVVVEHPRQFPSMAACYRHARRYTFDPLLYKKHAKRFRKNIEVKKILSLTVHRPQHYAALGALCIFFVCGSGMLIGSWRIPIVSGLLLLLIGALYKYKYQGATGFTVRRIGNVFGFVLIPFVYVYSLLIGCFRYKSFGVLR